MPLPNQPDAPAPPPTWTLALRAAPRDLVLVSHAADLTVEVLRDGLACPGVLVDAEVDPPLACRVDLPFGPATDVGGGCVVRLLAGSDPGDVQLTVRLRGTGERLSVPLRVVRAGLTLQQVGQGPIGAPVRLRGQLGVPGHAWSALAGGARSAIEVRLGGKGVTRDRPRVHVDASGSFVLDAIPSAVSALVDVRIAAFGAAARAGLSAEAWTADRVVAVADWTGARRVAPALLRPVLEGPTALPAWGTPHGPYRLRVYELDGTEVVNPPAGAGPRFRVRWEATGGRLSTGPSIRPAPGPLDLSPDDEVWVWPEAERVALTARAEGPLPDPKARTFTYRVLSKMLPGGVPGPTLATWTQDALDVSPAVETRVLTAPPRAETADDGALEAGRPVPVGARLLARWQRTASAPSPLPELAWEAWADGVRLASIPAGAWTVDLGRPADRVTEPCTLVPAGAPVTWDMLPVVPGHEVRLVVAATGEVVHTARVARRGVDPLPRCGVDHRPPSPACASPRMGPRDAVLVHSGEHAVALLRAVRRAPTSELAFEVRHRGHLVRDGALGLGLASSFDDFVEWLPGGRCRVVLHDGAEGVYTFAGQPGFAIASPWGWTLRAEALADGGLRLHAVDGGSSTFSPAGTLAERVTRAGDRIRLTRDAADRPILAELLGAPGGTRTFSLRYDDGRRDARRAGLLVHLSDDLGRGWTFSYEVRPTSARDPRRRRAADALPAFHRRLVGIRRSGPASMPTDPSCVIGFRWTDAGQLAEWMGEGGYGLTFDVDGHTVLRAWRGADDPVLGDRCAREPTGRPGEVRVGARGLHEVSSFPDSATAEGGLPVARGDGAGPARTWAWDGHGRLLEEATPGRERVRRRSWEDPGPDPRRLVRARVEAVGAGGPTPTDPLVAPRFTTWDGYDTFQQWTRTIGPDGWASTDPDARAWTRTFDPVSGDLVEEVGPEVPFGIFGPVGPGGAHRWVEGVHRPTKRQTWHRPGVLATSVDEDGYVTTWSATGASCVVDAGGDDARRSVGDGTPHLRLVRSWGGDGDGPERWSVDIDGVEHRRHHTLGGRLRLETWAQDGVAAHRFVDRSTPGAIAVGAVAAGDGSAGPPAEWLLHVSDEVLSPAPGGGMTLAGATLNGPRRSVQVSRGARGALRWERVETRVLGPGHTDTYPEEQVWTVDAAGRPAELRGRRFGLTSAASFGRDALGRVATVTSDGNTEIWTWDLQDRPLTREGKDDLRRWRWGADGSWSEEERWALGTSVAGQPRSSRLELKVRREHDRLGRVVRVYTWRMDPLGAPWTLALHQDREWMPAAAPVRLTAESDPATRAEIETRWYDRRGHPTRRRLGAGPSELGWYDGAGRMGAWGSADLDAAGSPDPGHLWRVTRAGRIEERWQETWTGGAVVATKVESVERGALGRIVRRRWVDAATGQERERVATWSAPSSVAIREGATEWSLELGAGEDVRSVTSGGRTVAAVRDLYGNLLARLDDGGSPGRLVPRPGGLEWTQTSASARVDLDAQGRVQAEEYGDGVTKEHHYDAGDRRVGFTLRRAADHALLYALEWSLDAFGRQVDCWMTLPSGERVEMVATRGRFEPVVRAVQLTQAPGALDHLGPFLVGLGEGAWEATRQLGDVVASGTSFAFDPLGVRRMLYEAGVPYPDIWLRDKLGSSGSLYEGWGEAPAATAEALAVGVITTPERYVELLDRLMAGGDPASWRELGAAVGAELDPAFVLGAWRVDLPGPRPHLLPPRLAPAWRRRWSDDAMTRAYRSGPRRVIRYADGVSYPWVPPGGRWRWLRHEDLPGVDTRQFLADRVRLEDALKLAMDEHGVRDLLERVRADTSGTFHGGREYLLVVTEHGGVRRRHLFHGAHDSVEPDWSVVPLEEWGRVRLMVHTHPVWFGEPGPMFSQNDLSYSYMLKLKGRGPRWGPPPALFADTVFEVWTFFPDGRASVSTMQPLRP